MMKQADLDDIEIVAEMAFLLWPDHDISDLKFELSNYISTDNGVVFICFCETVPVGFAQCSLRKDYVEGTQSSPVGYLEGIFVKEDYRKRGIGNKLLIQCEEWAKSKGCSEFASDCELNNTESFKFHLRLGFEETNRIICFKKNL